MCVCVCVCVCVYVSVCVCLSEPTTFLHSLIIHICTAGQCFDSTTSSPTPGLEYVLGTASQPEKFDTIVMANLGYFQLKAAPGAWVLKLREGRSSEIYSVVRFVRNSGCCPVMSYCIVILL